VKIHRDLFLSPKNTTEETNKLEISFKKNLENVFEHYTPIVIGYGGNDGSLMGFLGDLEEIEGGIFWCYRETGSGLSTEIEDLIKKFNGCCVPISGFDELMMQIGDKLEYGRMDEQIKEIAEQRAKTYKEQVEKATEEESTDPVTKKAISDMVSRGEKDWWYYARKALAEKDLDKREQIYLAAISNIPESYELLGNYALFLHQTKKEYDEAEVNYKKAIELGPSYAINLGNYAHFLHKIKKEYDKAEEYYKKAIESDPIIGAFNASYALFLHEIRKDSNRAERYYKEAIKVSPHDANAIANFSKLLIENKEFDRAKIFIEKSFRINQGRRKDIELELWFYCYAVFFTEYKDAPKKIEELIKQGVKSPGWNLSGVLEIAKEMNHPNYKKLEEYAKLITEEV
jgi:Tfp pilus assembly protein PilF